MTLTPRLIAFLTLPPLLWAGNAVVGRMTIASVPPLLLNAMRWWLALAVLLVLGWRAVATSERRRDIMSRWRYLARVGLFGVGAYNALQYMALTTSTPLNVTLIASSMPVWMLLVGLIGYGERPRLQQVISALLSLAGVAMVLGRGSLDVLLQVHFNRGDLWMLLAAASWAVYSWMLVRPSADMQGAQRPTVQDSPDSPPRPWNWAEYLLVQTLYGMLWASAAAGIESTVSTQPVHWSPGVVAALFYIVAGPSVVAYWFWGRGVAQAGPTVASFFVNLTPLFAALLSAALLGEVPHWYHAAAFALIVSGIVVSGRK